MATFDTDFTSLLASVVANCDEIGSYISNSPFIVEKYEGMSALHGYNVARPFEYLKEWYWTRSWDEYFSHVMDLWDEDKMSAMKFNRLIERFSAPAARLDVLVPRLERECGRLPNMPESVVRNAREMHTCVNSFLNSADDGLNLWKRRENILVESEIRQRRPIVRQDPALDDAESDVEAESTEEQLGNDVSSIRHHLNAARGIFTSNAALLALTGIISIISCIIQTRAFYLSTELRGKSRGSIHDPDFHNALQTFLMQTLALYTVLAPALRFGGPRYGFWTWVLSLLSLVSGIASVVVYSFFTTLSPLLACVSSVLQAFVMLQLIFSINDKSQDPRTAVVKKDV
ncbi:MAG: hypothetical protein M1825_004875 [Sarcosagium campestre]|nr:MAG: hypothetical protein M1825_004875 [Sarcosagium campestre]